MYRRFRFALAALPTVLASLAAAAAPRMLDDFEALDGWKAEHSEGAGATLSLAPGRDGQALALGFDLSRSYGFALARKEFPLHLPEDFVVSFDLRAESPVNNFEFKILDSHGNVWWQRKVDLAFPDEWTTLHVRRRHLTYAWGGDPKAPLSEVRSIDFVVASGTGGKGRLLIDNLRFEPIDAAAVENARAAVSASSMAGSEPPLVDAHGTEVTGWRTRVGDAGTSLTVDFGITHEVGAVVLDWEPDRSAPEYDVSVSDDGETWRGISHVEGANGGRDYVYCGEQSGRWLRLSLPPTAPAQEIALARLSVLGPDRAASENAFLATVARDQPRGSFPRYLLPEQSYWTIVGSPRDPSESLLNEDGAIEVDQLQFSLEPFLLVDGRFLTWSDVARTQSLEHGYLPIPSVTWRAGDVALTVTALAAGAAGAESRLIATYRVAAEGRPVHGTLFIAARPFQVNPPWQSLQHPAGWARVDRIDYSGGVLRVNDRVVVPLDAPDAGGATSFAAGEIVEHLRRGHVPAATSARDSQGFASGALAYGFDLKAGEAMDFRLAVPYHGWSGEPAAAQSRAAVDAFVSAAHDTARRTWESMLDRFHVRLPPAAQPVIDTIKSNLAYVFINQDGPGIQPGSRNYERSWIRDGSLTSTALLELGLFDEVRAYTDWYAQFQFPSGRIPCVVDKRGGDPTDEHDSHGQMIYLIRQVHHFTHDDAWLRGKFDTVVKTVRFIQSLRAQRKTELYRTGTPVQRACYGLVPESISHEGYSAKPMHSYWDDFFILRGLKDATEIAEILGETAFAREFAAERDDFVKDLYASMHAAIRNTGIDFIPGCVELGDFDATSTTVGLSPANELGRIPEPELHRTFEKYYERFVQRRDGKVDWLDYTPYENRVIGSFVLLGQRERAHETLDWFMAQRRPAAWNHWAEVVFRDERLPRTIGDMPHTWCGSDFIRSVRMFFVYEREQDAALVLGAGLSDAWVLDPAGIDVSHMPTYYGPVDYTVRSHDDGREVVVTIGGDLHVPAGGVILKSPRDRPIRAVSGGGGLVRPGGDEIRIDRLPATVSIHY